MSENILEKLQTLVNEQASKSTAAKKAAKVTRVIFITIIMALIVFVSAIIACASANMEWAISIMNWISTNWGITLTIPLLTALGVMLRSVWTINAGNTSTNDVLAEAVDCIVTNNDNTAKEMSAMQATIDDLKTRITIQPETLIAIENKSETTNEMASVMFKVAQLFFAKNGGDSEINSLFSSFEKSELFKKAAALVNPVVVTEIKEAAKEVVNTTENFTTKAKSKIAAIKAVREV